MLLIRQLSLSVEGNLNTSHWKRVTLQISTWGEVSMRIDLLILTRLQRTRFMTCGKTIIAAWNMAMIFSNLILQPILS